MKPNHSLKTLLLTLFTLLLLPLMGCGNHSHTRQQLLHAEDIMEEHPDSAYTILSSMKMDSTISEEDRALHALLHTQSMHKTDRIWRDSVTNNAVGDSLINIALNYYENAGNDSLLMKALYYRGEIDALSQDEFVNALKPLSRSLEIALKLKNDFWTARNYNSIATVYYSGGAFNDEVEAQKKALEYFKRTGKENFIKYNTSEYATALHNAGRYDEALEVENELLKTVTPEVDPLLWSEVMHIVAKIHFVKNEYKECIDDIEELERYDLRDQDLELFRILAYLYLGLPTRAREYYAKYEDELDNQDKAIIENISAQLSGDRKRQLESLGFIYNELTEEYTKFTNMSFNSIQMKVNQDASSQHELQKKEIKHDNTLITFLILAISLLLIGGIVLKLRKVYLKKRHAETELEHSEVEKDRITQVLNIEKELTRNIREKYNDLDNEYKKLESEHEKLGLQKSEIDKELKESLQKIERLRQQKEELSEKSSTLLSEMKSLKEEKNRIEQGLKEELEEKQQLLSLNKTVIQEKENAINERKELESELTELRQLYDDARSDITILRKAGLKFSRLLTVLSKEKDKSTLSPRTTLGKIKIEFDKYRPGARNLKDWETLLNQKYDNILENLSHDIPDLTKEEKAISVYLIMGFTNASICYLCNLKGRQEEFMITKLRNKIKALPEEKRKRYRLLMSTTQEEDI